jgi:N-acetylneuraminic acid mutarotase
MDYMAQRCVRLLVCLSFLIAFSVPHVSAGQNSFNQIIWTDDAMQPYFVSEAHSTVVGSKLYSFGGFDSIKQSQGLYTPTRRAYVYDPSSKVWTPIKDMPKGLTHAGLTNDGTNIYYAGGYIENASQTGQIFGTKEVWRYNVATDDYTALPGLPIDRAAGQLAYVDGKLYYIGGTNKARNQDVANVYMLDINNLPSGWVEKSPLPNPRHHAGAVVYEGKIYYVGGQKKHDGALEPQNSVHQYDPDADIWTELAPMPGVGRNHAGSTTFLFAKRILVLAGQTDADEATNTVFAYDLRDNTWIELAPLPVLQHSAIGGVIDGVIYFGMGAVGGDNKKLLRRGVPVIAEEPTQTSAPTLEPTSTDTSLPTKTPIIVPTAQDTPSSGVELLANGGFENTLDGWQTKRAADEKIKCNKPEKTYEGLCYFQFKVARVKTAYFRSL